jgi:hypothetical protein
MATIVTRAGKGTPLTNAEVDANFVNLNDDKLEIAGGVITGNLGIGGDTTGVVDGITVTSKFCVKSSGPFPVGGFVFANNTSAETGSGVFYCRSRGTLASPSIVQNNDRLATLFFAGHDGVDLALAAQIEIEVDGVPGSNDMPTRMIFKTTPAGQQTPVEAIRIGANQVVTLANALPIASGGTGQTTAGAAINALLPSQSGNSGRFLTTNGTSPSWANVPAPNNGTLTLAVSGTGLSGSALFTADQAGNSTFTVTSNATSANTAGAIVARDGSGNFTAGTITAALSGNASTATSLATGRTIGMTGDVTWTSGSFNGSANVTGTATLATTGVTAGSYGGNNSIPSITVDAKGRVTAVSTVTPSGTYAISISGSSASTTGNAATATTLQTARLIGGVSFNGSANINLPGVNTAGNQNTTGSAATLTTARTINGVSFNGSANITVTANTTSTLTLGTGLTGTSFNGSAAVTAAVSYGTTAGTACQGNDSRLSDARQATNTNTQLASLGVGTAASGTAGQIRATGTIEAGFSDDRLKTKLGNIEDALSKVRALSGFYYVANETAQALGYEAVREVGVSAQEVQAVQPETVAAAPIDEQYLTVRYERLVPLLIEAIKELDADLQSLKAQLKG